jgi:GT2 family glycosyltransferase
MISVIIPTYKSPQVLDLCLQSAIEGQSNENQIIVVVDGYYDINKEVLEKHSKSIDILNLEENVGLCRGTNLGVYNAKYDPILIVNDDNVFPLGWDTKLLSKFQPGWVFAPNQIEPNPSMFPQFNIKNLGCTVEEFDLKTFQEYEQTLSVDKTEFNGSTLPIFMSKQDYLTVNGWDENYSQGMVSDWDFFLKCNKAGFQMVRTYHTHFYHFASISVNGEKRQQAEMNAHQWAMYKWGKAIKHNPENNLKYL